MPRRKAIQKKGKSGFLEDQFVGEEMYEKLKGFVLKSPEGTKITSQRNLADQFGISLTTVKRMLDRLAEEKLVEIIHGRGCFVRKNALEDSEEDKVILYFSLSSEPDHQFFFRRLKGVLEKAGQYQYKVQIIEQPQGQGINVESIRREVENPAVVAIMLPYIVDPIYDKLKAIDPKLKIVVFNPGLPVDDVVAVTLDNLTYGRQAGYFFNDNQCKKVVAVGNNREYLLGCEMAVEGSREKIQFSSFVPEDFDTVKAQDIRRVLTAGVDGIAFLDDRYATGFLKLAMEKEPKLLKQVKVVSCSNYGESILPAQVSRLEIDGRLIGIKAVQAIHEMLETPDSGNSSICVGAKLIVA